MSKTMRLGWVGLALAMGVLAGAQEQNAEPAQQAATSTSGALPHTEGSVENGAAKAAVCVACHGVNGNSTNPEWPNLAGQNAVYIAQQLHLFRSGVRQNPLMSPMAAPLSDQDINDLAVYYAAQTPAGLEADPSYWQAGESLYRNGDAERGIPACIACHGPVGHGNPAAGYPSLIAQHSVYTVNQLNSYANGTRYSGANESGQVGPNAEMMISIAKRLTPEDIRNLASYIQGLR
jgi:cytochrome c553